MDANGNKNGGLRIFINNLESITNPKVNTMLEDCVNIHTESDLLLAASRILINPNPLDLKANKVFIIAEAACNHMCSIELAKAMIDHAAEAGGFLDRERTSLSPSSHGRRLFLLLASG